MTDASDLLVDLAAGVLDLDEQHTLAWTVDDDGQRWPVIIGTERARVPYGPELEALAPHERLGPLPTEVADRCVPDQAGP